MSALFHGAGPSQGFLQQPQVGSQGPACTAPRVANPAQPVPQRRFTDQELRVSYNFHDSDWLFNFRPRGRETVLNGPSRVFKPKLARCPTTFKTMALSNMQRFKTSFFVLVYNLKWRKDIFSMIKHIISKRCMFDCVLLCLRYHITQ